MYKNKIKNLIPKSLNSSTCFLQKFKSLEKTSITWKSQVSYLGLMKQVYKKWKEELYLEKDLIIYSAKYKNLLRKKKNNDKCL